MSYDEINRLVGIFAILIITLGEVFLYYKLKKDWDDRSKKGENIFIIISMVAGLFVITVATISIYLQSK